MQWSEFSFVLKPSPLGGVGVFATHDIPTGTLLFNQEINHTIRMLKIKDVPLEALKFCIFVNDEECLCPERFDRLEIGWYINHSDAPNVAQLHRTKFDVVKSVEDLYRNREKYRFYAIKDIKEGDEIVINYNELNEPEHLKEEFYKQK